MNLDQRGTVNYPMFPDNTFMMSIRALESSNVSAYHTTLDMPRSDGVWASTNIDRDSSTEVIDVNRLSQRHNSVIQYVEVAASKGRLYCVDSLVNASCWLKIVTIARDCQSSNVELMSTEKGVVLKTIKCIPAGEPLLMWFNQSLLAMMNIPFLTPSNIRGDKRYTCHMCNNHFEYPNPLKLHLVLRCDSLDSEDLWNILAKEFRASALATLAINLNPQNFGHFGFTLLGSPQTSPTRTSPIIVAGFDPNMSMMRNSPSLSKVLSPSLLHPPSSPSLSVKLSTSEVSPTSTSQRSPTLRIPSSPFRPTLSPTRPASRIQVLPTSPIQVLPISTIKTSPTSSITTSPTSSIASPTRQTSTSHGSPNSTIKVSPTSTTQMQPVRKNNNLVNRGSSAFKPYMSKLSEPPPKNSNIYHTSYSITNRCNNDTIHTRNTYRHVPSAPLRTDNHAAQMETIVSNLGKSKQGHLCIYCGKVYSRKYGLKIHIRTHTGYKPLKCKYCLRPFGDPSNLNKHVRLHADGETPYRCDLCSKVLVRRRDLERHMRSRHQESVGHVSDVSSDGMDT